MLEFIGAADIYVTPYQNEAQIISGTLAYALGMGKAVVSTPYWHAQELLADDRGRLIPFRDSVALAREVIDLLDHPDECRAIQERAYQYGRQRIWSDVGRRYLALDEIVRDHLNQQLLELWERTQKTIAFVTHSIPEAVYLSTKIVVMSPRPGRIADVIESTLPRERPLDIRDSQEFQDIAHRVREGLRAGHAYDD